MAKKRPNRKRKPRKEVGVEQDTGNVDTRGMPIPGKPKQRKQVTPEERTYMLERELRRYVRRGGGFRKNLPKNHKEVAQRIMKKLGRKKPEWDKSIVVFGVDKPTVARINVDAS